MDRTVGLACIQGYTCWHGNMARWSLFFAARVESAQRKGHLHRRAGQTSMTFYKSLRQRVFQEREIFRNFWPEYCRVVQNISRSMARPIIDRSPNSLAQDVTCPVRRFLWSRRRQHHLVDHISLRSAATKALPIKGFTVRNCQSDRILLEFCSVRCELSLGLNHLQGSKLSACQFQVSSTKFE